MSEKKKNKSSYVEVELSKRLRSTLDKVLASQAKKNIPIVYKDALCIKSNQFVHEYSNGNKYLIQQDQTDSTEIILRKY